MSILLSLQPRRDSILLSLYKSAGSLNPCHHFMHSLQKDLSHIRVKLYYKSLEEEIWFVGFLNKSEFILTNSNLSQNKILSCFIFKDKMLELIESWYSIPDFERDYRKPLVNYIQIFWRNVFITGGQIGEVKLLENSSLSFNYVFNLKGESYEVGLLEGRNN